MSITGKKSEAVTIKGSAGGLLVRLRDDVPSEWPVLVAELTERLQAGQRFFQGGQAHLELGSRLLEPPQLEEIKAVMAQHGVELATVIAGTQATRNVAKQVGLPFKLPSNQNTRPPTPVIEGNTGSKAENVRAGQPFDSAEALFLRRTVRSGQRIEHHADVVVLGDVNPGAEIIAGGSVIVWGTVRGQIQAGQIQAGAVICALSLRPTQLRIGEVLAVGSQEALNEPIPGPEIATVENGAIVLESWQPKQTRR